MKLKIKKKNIRRMELERMRLRNTSTRNKTPRDLLCKTMQIVPIPESRNGMQKWISERALKKTQKPFLDEEKIPK